MVITWKMNFDLEHRGQRSQNTEVKGQMKGSIMCGTCWQLETFLFPFDKLAFGNRLCVTTAPLAAAVQLKVRVYSLCILVVLYSQHRNMSWILCIVFIGEEVVTQDHWGQILWRSTGSAEFMTSEMGYRNTLSLSLRDMRGMCVRVGRKKWILVWPSFRI